MKTTKKTTTPKQPTHLIVLTKEGSLQYRATAIGRLGMSLIRLRTPLLQSSPEVKEEIQRINSEQDGYRRIGPETFSIFGAKLPKTAKLQIPAALKILGFKPSKGRLIDHIETLTEA